MSISLIGTGSLEAAFAMRVTGRAFAVVAAPEMKARRFRFASSTAAAPGLSRHPARSCPNSLVFRLATAWARW